MEGGRTETMWLPAAEKSVPELLAPAFARHAERTAILDRGTSLSYREVDLQANRIAHWLLANGAEASPPSP